MTSNTATAGHILLVEHDPESAQTLSDFLRQEGYAVVVCANGVEGLAALRQGIPNLVVLSTTEVDRQFFERRFRASTLFTYIPIFLLLPPDTPRSPPGTIELDAEYMIKPDIDLQELYLRLRFLINRQMREGFVDTHTGLPSWRMMESNLLRLLLARDTDWVYVTVVLDRYETFVKVYGEAAGEALVRAVGAGIYRVLDQVGTTDDHAAHCGAQRFAVLTQQPRLEMMLKALGHELHDEILRHHPPVDEAVIQAALDPTHEIGDALARHPVLARERRLPFVRLLFNVTRDKTRERTKQDLRRERFQNIASVVALIALALLLAPTICPLVFGMAWSLLMIGR